MSAEEGPELRELIAQTLENNGVLAKIRAQLRASVILAIEDQEAFQTKVPFTNQPLRTFLKTFEGAFITCLVREFLEFFNLDFTLSVFDPETFHGKEYSYGGRTELMKELKLQNNSERNAPVLSCLLQNVLKHSEKPTENDIASKKSDILSVPSQDASVADSVPDTSRILDISLNEDSVSVQTRNRQKSQEKYGPTEETVSTSKKDDSSKISKGSVSHTSSKSEKLPQATAGKRDTDFSDGIYLQHGSQLTSLSNLPPLAGMLKNDVRPTAVQMSKSSEGDRSMKPLINLGNETADNYEEDFQSSVSGSGQGGKSGKLTTPGSDTEIEEDIGTDDILSNASVTDDLTVDVTASNLSGVGDYMENIS
ncbi:centrosomal protein 43-like isoform X1 [Schistocerca gregaria]|uniref:centrosomal protein 43-like isoform X1 n=1 Tax=Schistocerca gregaria TaxID=7010 RepID=UPI00211E0D50|nr:centrosomal protein 43-like isoform X1 [Schistocerca gregaria]